MILFDHESWKVIDYVRCARKYITKYMWRNGNWDEVEELCDDTREKETSRPCPLHTERWLCFLYDKENTIRKRQMYARPAGTALYRSCDCKERLTHVLGVLLKEIIVLDLITLRSKLGFFSGCRYYDLHIYFVCAYGANALDSISETYHLSQERRFKRFLHK